LTIWIHPSRIGFEILFLLLEFSRETPYSGIISPFYFFVNRNSEHEVEVVILNIAPP